MSETAMSKTVSTAVKPVKVKQRWRRSAWGGVVHGGGWWCTCSGGGGGGGGGVGVGVAGGAGGVMGTLTRFGIP